MNLGLRMQLGALQDQAEPRDLPGLILDLDASIGVTLSGANVDSWKDRKSGIVATGSGATRPVFNNTSVFNDRPSLSFSSSAGSRLDNTIDILVPQSGARSIFAVLRASDVSGGTVIDFKRSNPDFAIQWFDTASLRFVFSDSVTNIFINSPPAIEDTSYYMSWIESGTGSLPIFRANGIGYAINGGTTMPAEPSGSGFCIGCRPSFGQSFEGEIAALFIYASALSDAHRDLIEGYLKVKYGL